MARPPSRHPTELELEILKIIWQDGPSSVSHVRQQLANFRKLAHTSVLTIMVIMTDKRYLKRFKDGKRYIYETRVPEQQTTSKMLGDLVNRVFDGSATAAMVQLLEMGDIDDKELAKLRKLILQKEKGQ